MVMCPSSSAQGEVVDGVRACCVWSPGWAVTAARRRDPSLLGIPVVVRERAGSREVVRAVSSEARAEGVTVGMRRREAEARCPGVVVVDSDPHSEAAAFETVARAVESITPRVELDRPGLLSFPTRGPSRYFGGDDALAARVHEVVAAVLAGMGAAGGVGHGDGGGDRRAAGAAGAGEGAPLQIGIADGRFAARLAARSALVEAPGRPSVLVVAPSGSAAFVAPFPVAALGDPALADLLARLGLPTLGDFAALPAEAVAARFGPGGHHLHGLACGLDGTGLALTEPPPDLVERIELDPPATRVDTATFAAKVLADRLLGRLSERCRINIYEPTRRS